nr:hypothetical protein [Tanacetum cinerariifolium]
VAENVFVKVEKFYFPVDFVVLDFIADPRVSLILGRPFLSTAYAIIDVHEREIILRQDKQSLTLKYGDTPSILQYKFESLNKVYLIDAGESDFYSEEIENFLNDDSNPIGIENSEFNIEEDILFLKIVDTTLIKELDEVIESSTKNLIPIPRECEVTSDNGSESNEPVKDDSLVFTTFPNPLFNDKDDVTIHKDAVPMKESKNFLGPLVPIHIAEEQRIRREHAKYLSRMEMLFTINPRPRPTVNANTIVESIPSSLIPIQDNDSQREEIKIVTKTDELLPPGFKNDDSDEEVDVVEELHVDNSIFNFKHELFDNEESNFDNPLVPRPPPESPDAEQDAGDEILVVRNTIEELDPIDEFDDDDYSSFIFSRVFSFLLFAKSEDTIFDPNFKRMTATLKYRDVPNDAIKLMFFPYSLEGDARIWYEKEPFNSILTWDDLVNKFVNQFFLPSKTTYLKNEISRFTQRFEETFGEAWDRFKEMLRASDSRRDSVSKTNDRIDKLADQISNLVEIVNKQVVAPAKAVEKTCATCGGARAYYDCIATDSNQPSVCAEIGSYNQVSLPNQASHQIPPPGFAPVQKNPNSNVVPNPKGEMKVVTTRGGLAYEGPSIPTNSPLEKVDEQKTKEIIDKEHSNCLGSTAQVQPSVVPIFIPEPDVPRTQPKPTIPYPSRLNDQNLREKATNQMEKFFQIFHDFHFDISFADALLLMPKFASTIKRMEVCHALADLGASINLMPLSIWKKLSLPELTLTRMTLELADRSITHPKGVSEYVFVKVGKFYFPTDFMVVDFEADPRVPLILARSFLRTGRVLIDVYGEEITLRVNEESVTFNLNQTMKYSSTYDDNSVNRVDVIDIACEEFVQDVLDFQYNSKISNPTLVCDPIISESDSYKEPIVKSSSPTLTPFGENPFQLPLMDLKLAEESKAKSYVEEPPELESKELPSHLEYAFLEESNKLPVIIAQNLKVVEKEALINVLKSHKWAIAWKIFDIKGIDPRVCTHKILMEDDYKLADQSQRRVNSKIHDVIKKEVIKLLDAGMIHPVSDSPWRVCIDYRKLNDATRKDHFPLPFLDQMLERLAGNEFYCFLDGFSGEGIVLGHKISKSGIEVDRAKVDVIAKLPPLTRLLEKETPFVFSKECVDDFNTLKKKLTEAPILVVPDWNLPFELLCDASDFAIGAVMGQRKTKHFQPIHYESKTMTEDQIHYTTTEKEMLAVVYAFEKFRPYLVLSKSIVYMDHSALKYFLNKQDAKPRLENPHKDVLKNKDINENFPLEALGSLSSNSTPWFADIANFHAGNFIKKGLTSQQKKKFSKM